MTIQSTESVTIGTYLMRYDSSAEEYAKICDIKDYPDIGGEPDTVEITDLTNRFHRNLKGVQTNDSKAFLANFIPEVYETLLDFVEDDEATPGKYSVWFGDEWDEDEDDYVPTGSFGKFSFDGQLAVYLNGKGVNEAREMTIVITPSTPIDSELDYTAPSDNDG